MHSFLHFTQIAPVLKKKNKEHVESETKAAQATVMDSETDQKPQRL